jgi:hypothetical protein
MSRRRSRSHDEAMLDAIAVVLAVGTFAVLLAAIELLDRV